MKRIICYSLTIIIALLCLLGCDMDKVSLVEGTPNATGDSLESEVVAQSPEVQTPTAPKAETYVDIYNEDGIYTLEDMVPQSALDNEDVQFVENDEYRGLIVPERLHSRGSSAIKEYDDAIYYFTEEGIVRLDKLTRTSELIYEDNIADLATTWTLPNVSLLVYEDAVYFQLKNQIKSMDLKDGSEKLLLDLDEYHSETYMPSGGAVYQDLGDSASVNNFDIYNGAMYISVSSLTGYTLEIDLDSGEITIFDQYNDCLPSFINGDAYYFLGPSYFSLRDKNRIDDPGYEDNFYGYYGDVGQFFGGGVYRMDMESRQRYALVGDFYEKDIVCENDYVHEVKAPEFVSNSFWIDEDLYYTTDVYMDKLIGMYDENAPVTYYKMYQYNPVGQDELLFQYEEERIVDDKPYNVSGITEEMVYNNDIYFVLEYQYDIYDDSEKNKLWEDGGRYYLVKYDTASGIFAFIQELYRYNTGGMQVVEGNLLYKGDRNSGNADAWPCPQVVIIKGLQ